MERHLLADIIEPVVESLGYETIRILTSGTVRQTLQVMIDVEDGSRQITVDDCALVSRALSKVLDDKDPIKDQYSLEVSSPGIDRPLTKPNHFRRFKGFEAKVETINEVEKRKRIKGIITDVDDKDNIHINMENKEFIIAFDNVAKAKLVLTDELLKAFQTAVDDENTEL